MSKLAKPEPPIDGKDYQFNPDTLQLENGTAEEWAAKQEVQSKAEMSEAVRAIGTEADRIPNEGAGPAPDRRYLDASHESAHRIQADEEQAYHNRKFHGNA